MTQTTLPYALAAVLALSFGVSATAQVSYNTLGNLVVNGSMGVTADGQPVAPSLRTAVGHIRARYRFSSRRQFFGNQECKRATAACARLEAAVPLQPRTPSYGAAAHALPVLALLPCSAAPSPGSGARAPVYSLHGSIGHHEQDANRKGHREFGESKREGAYISNRWRERIVHFRLP
jgi:hypothetical protein